MQVFFLFMTIFCFYYIHLETNIFLKHDCYSWLNFLFFLLKKMETVQNKVFEVQLLTAAVKVNVNIIKGWDYFKYCGFEITLDNSVQMCHNFITVQNYQPHH